MKQRILASAIKRIVWAELALTATLAAPAFAQSQPAPGAAAAPAQGSGIALAQADAATGATGAASATGAVSAPAAAAPAPASGAAATGTPPAAPEAKPGVAQIKRFEVTGSLIRSADKVGFQQVQTVTAKDIQDSGYTNVADFLRGVSANSASSWSEGQTNGFAAGGAGIALRGLSEKYSLVMVDGQRVAPYAFASNGTDTFFDLNTLPLNIIDRIEIVKTGAVSQYGSDAIAGVVNIITKHNYQGLQLDGSYSGATQGGDGTTKFSILGGFGNLNSDRFNITAAASYYKSNGFTIADRDTTKNQDFTNRAGGLSLLAPSFWQTNGGATAQALSNCPFGGAVRPAASNYLSAGAGMGGTVCGFNSAESTSIAPWTERLSAKVHADFKIDDKTTAFADLWESNNTTVQNNGVLTVGSPTTPSLVLNPATGKLSQFNSVVPASNPYNPFGVDTPLAYTFPAAASDRTSSNFWRAATGVKGSFALPYGDWDWSAAYTHSQSVVSNTFNNVLNASVVNDIYQNGTLNFANPSATPNAFNGLYMKTSNLGVSKLDALDATLSTPNLFKLPTGDVGFGLGAQFLHESEFIGQGSEALSGQVLNPLTQSVSGSRNVAAVYYQFDIPIIKNLTFSQSGRYDHYSDFGGAFSPRFALRYQPIKEFTMYGSYNRGFRAPTFVENTPSQNIGLQTYGNSLINTLQTGNTSLQPERTRNINIGFQASPTRYTDFGFDFYKIFIDNVIGQASLNSVVAANNPSQVVRDPVTGQITYVVLPYQNLGTLETDGFEMTFRQALPTKYGTFTLSADWAYVHHFNIGFPGAATVDSAGNNFAITQPFGASIPRWKGNTSLNWAYRKWNATLSWEFTGPYAQALGVAAPTQAADHVGSYSQFNLYASYTGFKNWTLYGGINNIFDRAPPFDPVWQNALNQNGYDQSLYMYYGRVIQVGATYRF
ncbi:tonB dependent receptor family protein [Burkholderia thailandensis MSMB121]|uniref:TonB-dependent receptor n=1 Tax=Burkholderia humptydooensis TaxID=430531 RepID=UPI0003281149|nr:TonB-dependent receptor [Burkholderia humptydooensis]AGK50284.1 tonB dependent receptor family protein [Burkholderia thailandensis MSMB121]ATF33706.1 TonB-dependent receptor [Burkholderia thailandensis]KST71786.1 TonB-dependent receptor [Burkholderia humptydooensis]